MKAADVYVDLDGNKIALGGLDADERRMVAGLRRRARTHPDWTDFDGFWMRDLTAFYDSRGVGRSAMKNTVGVRIALDLAARLGMAQGTIRPDDYRDELANLIDKDFPSRRAFCKATGISPDMLSHVLAGRKDLSLECLSKALARIGYRLRIVPGAGMKKTG